MQNEQAFIYKTNGEIIPILPQNKKLFTLNELQEIVGGYIELVYLNDGRVMVVNEEGMLFDFETNANASVLYPHSLIVGDVLVTPNIFIN